MAEPTFKIMRTHGLQRRRLRIRPHLTSSPINLHTHGAHISPRGKSTLVVAKSGGVCARDEWPCRGGADQREELTTFHCPISVRNSRRFIARDASARLGRPGRRRRAMLRRQYERFQVLGAGQIVEKSTGYQDLPRDVRAISTMRATSSSVALRITSMLQDRNQSGCLLCLRKRTSNRQSR